MLRFAYRRLAARPLFTALTVLTLAVGIGASATIFTILKTVLLDELPYRAADRLVTVVETDAGTAHPQTDSFATVDDWTRRTAVFDAVAVWADFGVRPILNGAAVMLRGMRVSVSYFGTLGIRAAIGRTFVESDATPGDSHVVLLTDDTWRTVFGGDPTVIGRAIPTTTGPVVVVGVLPPDFVPLRMTNAAERPGVFIPFASDAAQRSGRTAESRGVRVVARLRPGVDVRHAEATLNTTMRALIGEHREYARDTRLVVTPLRDALVTPIERPLWVLQAAVAALFLLACANGATMLLAQSMERRREIAIRTALGATRTMLLRDALSESALLALTAGATGAAIAWAVIVMVRRFADANIPLRFSQLRRCDVDPCR